MQTKLACLLLLFGLTASILHAIEWTEVRVHIAKSDPELIKVIERNFIVNKSGEAVHLGNSALFGDRVGERIPPYDFGAVRKGSTDHYHLRIQESADFEFTGRYQFTWEILKDKKKA